MGTATFVTADTTTQGTWIPSVYATANYYDILGDGFTHGAWLTFSSSGQSFTSWPASSDVRFMQPDTGIGRVTGVWYSFGTITLDLSITDGQTHRMAFYFYDGDNGGRAQNVQMLNADAGDAVIDTQALSGFYTTPKWLVWDCTGHVKLKVTLTGGPNCVINGWMFYNPPTTYIPKKANFGIGSIYAS